MIKRKLLEYKTVNMTLDKIISEKRLIDVCLFPEQTVSYTGVCIKASNSVWVLVNYDYKKEEYNGYTIFRSSIVETYTLWKKKAVNLKRNNIAEFAELSSLKKVKTLYSGLKLAGLFGLVAIFTESKGRPYFVGKIVSLNSKDVTVKLVDKHGKWSKRRTFNLREIDFISFYTDYEKRLMKKLNYITPR